MFRNRRLAPELKPFRFQIAMASRLIIERDQGLKAEKKRSHAYCSTIDEIMTDPDKAQSIFERSATAINYSISSLKVQGAALDRRTAKMKDMRDELRRIVSS